MIEPTIAMNPIERDRLFEFLADMGLLASPQGAIDYYRKNYPLYVRTQLVDDDIDGIGYYGSHFEIAPHKKDYLEIWVNDDYIHPDTMQWVDLNPHQSYGILGKRYPWTECKIFYNPDIVFRYHKLEKDDEFKMYVTQIDASEYPYNQFDITHATFYISHNDVHIPGVTLLHDSVYEIRAPYVNDIDLFICSNLANVVECNRWYGQLISPLTSGKVYCGIIVDHTDQGSLDASFYPVVQAKGILRAYTIGCREYRYPLGSFLMNYREFMNVKDPYHPQKDTISEDLYTFLNTYKPATRHDVIFADDSIETMYEKLDRICAGCYDVCDILPPNYEPANFIICDNTNQQNPSFTIDTVDGEECIRSTIPYEPFREILLYGKVPFYNKYDHKLIGDKEYYIIPTGYDPNLFTLIKFNAAEDTHHIMANSYLLKDNFLALHYKVNRFYRNMMCLRMRTIDTSDIMMDEVYAGTEEPPLDGHIWFEYINNTEPEEFESSVVEIFMNEKEIPDPIKKGMYALDLPSDGGKKSYTSIMDTYFKLSKFYEPYLTMTHDVTQRNPNAIRHNTIQLGDLEKNPDLLPNPKDKEELLIDSRDFDDPSARRDFYYSRGEEEPEILGEERNDLYVKSVDDSDNWLQRQNTKITEIEFNEKLPEVEDEAKLWIESELPVHSDELDLLHGLINAVQKNITIDSIDDPKEGMYALENISVPAPGPSKKKRNYDPIDFAADMDLSGDLTGVVASMPTEQKHDLVMIYLHDIYATESEKWEWWRQFIEYSDEHTLNLITRTLILTKSLYDIVDELTKEGALSLEIADDLLEGTRDAHIEVGRNLDDPDKDTAIVMRDFIYDVDGNPVYDDDMYEKQRAIQYILSLREPEDAVAGELWLNLRPTDYEGIIEDVLGSVILECGSKLPETVFPNMVLSEDGSMYLTSMIIDYGMHGGPNEPDIFQAVPTKLHKIIQGGNPKVDEVEDGAIWFEWLDTISGAVCYSSDDTYVLRMDDYLYGVEFLPDEDVEIFAFDDVVLHFNQYERGTKYLAILADLMGAGIISSEDILLFSNRLITCRDQVDPFLRRLYGRESNIVSVLRTHWENYSIIFSMNIGRFTMDYRTAGDREQENAYKMIIDLRQRDFAYLRGRMLLFVNGKYIRQDDISEPAPHLVQIRNFDEFIACVDIFYYKRDAHLINIKKMASDHWPEADRGKFIDPKQYHEMEFILEADKNYKGYYDVMYREYIETGYLMRRLNEIVGDEEAIEEFKKEMIEKFHDITDAELFHFDGLNRIVISCENHGHAFYEIK